MCIYGRKAEEMLIRIYGGSKMTAKIDGTKYLEQVKEALDRETAEWEEKERMNAGPDPEPSGQGLEMQQQKRGMRK